MPVLLRLAARWRWWSRSPARASASSVTELRRRSPPPSSRARLGERALAARTAARGRHFRGPSTPTTTRGGRRGRRGDTSGVTKKSGAAETSATASRTPDAPHDRFRTRSSHVQQLLPTRRSKDSRFIRLPADGRRRCDAATSSSPGRRGHVESAGGRRRPASRAAASCRAWERARSRPGPGSSRRCAERSRRRSPTARRRHRGERLAVRSRSGARVTLELNGKSVTLPLSSRASRCSTRCATTWT